MRRLLGNGPADAESAGQAESHVVDIVQAQRRADDVAAYSGELPNDISAAFDTEAAEVVDLETVNEAIIRLADSL